MSPSHDQIDVATRAWVLRYRKECQDRGVAPEETLPPLESLPADVVAAIQRCVKAALVAADPENVKRVLERSQD